MIDELNPGPFHLMIPNGRLDVPNGDADDLTPLNTPPSSPNPSRRRLISVSNPEPMIKLMVQGILQKVETFLEYLEDRLLLSVVEECNGIVKATVQGRQSKLRRNHAAFVFSFFIVESYNYIY